MKTNTQASNSILKMMSLLVLTSACMINGSFAQAARCDLKQSAAAEPAPSINSPAYNEWSERHRYSTNEYHACLYDRAFLKQSRFTCEPVAKIVVNRATGATREPGQPLPAPLSHISGLISRVDERSETSVITITRNGVDVNQGTDLRAISVKRTSDPGILIRTSKIGAPQGFGSIALQIMVNLDNDGITSPPISGGNLFYGRVNVDGNYTQVQCRLEGELVRKHRARQRRG